MQIKNYTFLKDLKYSGLFRISLAQEASTGHLVVVKSQLPLIEDAREANSFLSREADFLRSLCHTSIPKLVDFFEFKGASFLVIEYFRGSSLSDLIKEYRVAKEVPLWRDAALIMLEAVRCLDYLHREASSVPILHRDVTPHNILLTVNGEVKIIDFGISREDDNRITDPGLLKGKVGYMAPELIRCGRYSTTTDIFALGVTIMEFMLLEHVFKGKDFQEIIDGILNGAMPGSDRFSHADAAFTRVLFDAVSLEPSRRPTAYELVERLQMINPVKTLSAALMERVASLSERAVMFERLMSAEELGEETTDRIGCDDITLIKKID